MGEGKYYLKWFFRIGLAKFNQLIANWVTISKMKTILTKHYFHREINLQNPEKLNEKILWIEYNTDAEQRSRLTDKYEVRQYVAEKGYADALVPIYGIWRRAEDIDFHLLPERFVLKATHGCDMNYLCQKKTPEEINKMRRRMRLWMKHNLAYMSLETHYLDVQHGILCEEYLDCGTEDIVDYKFHCMDGKARFVLVCTNRSKEVYKNVFDLDWRPLHVIVGAKENPEKLRQPSCFYQMIEMANRLAEGIPFVRVDLYEVNGKIYFGEMTFTPATGVLFHFSDDFLIEQGKYCTLPSES